MSARSSRIGPSSFGSSEARCCPSPSRRTTRSKPSSSARRNPVWTAPPIPRLNGRRHDPGAGVARDARGAVPRAVVDHDDLEPVVERPDLADDAADRAFLVVRRDDRDAAQRREPRPRDRDLGRGQLRHRRRPSRRRARAGAAPAARRCAPRAPRSRALPAELFRGRGIGEKLAVRLDGLVLASARRRGRAPARTSARSPRTGWRRSPRRTRRARRCGSSTRPAPRRAACGRC